MGIILDYLLLGAIAAACIVVYRILKPRFPDNPSYRFGVGLALFAAFLLFYVNGAVGIIGSENNDANMMYAGVILIAFTGAFVAGFRPLGMARAMVAAALAQILVAAIALGAGLGVSGPIWPRDVIGITVFFAAMWFGSAALFRNAVRGEVRSADAGAESTG